MIRVTSTDTFIQLTARVLERHRYAYLFHDGPAEPVATALAAYRNPDGGYGHALEPDGRGPGSQPVHVLSAVTVLDELGALGGDLAAGIGDYLASVSAADGGVPFVHPNLADHPRAPWWAIPDTYEGSLIPTANIAGLLWRNKVDHPWLTTASEFCWRAIEAVTDTHPYEVLACVSFLDHVPDRDRAGEQAARIGALAREQRLVALGDDGHALTEGYTAGETHFPHDFAQHPSSLAREWFTDAEFDRSLDTLVADRREDGGWPVRWGIWTPVTEFEWRPVVTIEALKTLRAYERPQ